MAKLTTLQLLNKVLENSGLPTVTVLTNLNRIQQVAFNFLNESILGIASEGKWEPLVKAGSITLITSQEFYAKPADSDKIDRDSIRHNTTSRLKWLTEEELDDIIKDPTLGGAPRYLFERGGQIGIAPIPTLAQNNEIVKFRYWSIPIILNINTPTATSWLPEPYDQTVLVNMATARLLSYRRNPEAQVYLSIVEGQRGFIEGSLNSMRAKYTTPTLSRVKVKVF